MKATLALVLALVCTLSVSAFTIDTVPVGDVGNPNDPATGNLYGGVSSAYNIGKYEVTVGQYTAFLNAVAANDIYGLYNTSMASDANIAGIARNSPTCSPNCTYSVQGSPNHPVIYVSWGDAARFANWLSNGQPTGAEGPGTTETGAYTLNGATSNAALMAITRNPGAIWVIPTEKEWYKAAYYQPAAAGGDADGYWAYPMKTNSVPNSAPPPGSAAPDPTRVGNFYQDDGVANGYDNGEAVSDSISYALTDVGAYTSSPSYYGTFDQGGNVYEWNETVVNSSIRGLRGGAWDTTFSNLQASIRGGLSPTSEYGYIGFRLASIPEPATAALLCMGSLATILRRRRKRLG
jgi:formylglycine-generating enzyme